MTITEKLYALILKNFMKIEASNNFAKDINDLLNQGAQIFTNVPNNINNDRIFCAAVRLGNTYAVKTMLKYYKTKNINIDFRMQAEDDSANYKWNLLQYVCTLGDTEIMLACFNFIGDHPKEIKSILNTPVEYEGKNSRQEIITSTLTLGEIMAVELNQRSLIADLSRTLTTNINYTEETKQQILNYFKDIDIYSNKYSTARPPQIDRSLIDGIQIKVTGLSKLYYLVENNYIDVNAVSSRTKISFAQLVDGLAKPYFEVEKEWNSAFKTLLLKNLKMFEFIKVESNPDNTACLYVKLLKNSVGDNITPIYLELTIDYRELHKITRKKYEESQMPQTRNRDGSIDNLKQQMSKMVDNRKRDYLNSNASNIEKTCFSMLFETTQNYLLARQIASTTLFTPNTVTRNAKIAKNINTALTIALVAAPINTEVFTALSNMCVNYITGQHANKQTSGVLHATVTIDMPNTLVDLCEVMTKIITTTHESASEFEIAKIAKEISDAINTAVDQLYKLPEVNEDSVRELLLTSAIKSLGNIPINKQHQKNSLLYQHGGGVAAITNGQDFSNKSHNNSPNKGGGCCNMM